MFKLVNNYNDNDNKLTKTICNNSEERENDKDITARPIVLVIIMENNSHINYKKENPNTQ